MSLQSSSCSRPLIASWSRRSIALQDHSMMLSKRSKMRRRWGEPRRSRRKMPGLTSGQVRSSNHSGLGKK